MKAVLDPSIIFTIPMAIYIAPPVACNAVPMASADPMRWNIFLSMAFAAFLTVIHPDTIIRKADRNAAVVVGSIPVVAVAMNRTKILSAFHISALKGISSNDHSRGNKFLFNLNDRIC